MKRIAWLFLFAASGISLAHSQVPLPSAPPRAPFFPPTPNSPIDREAALFSRGPLTPVAGHADVYRTRAVGLIQVPVLDFNPAGILVGFDLTFHSAGASKRITSLRPTYLVDGNRVQGKAFGNPAGAREILLAKPGYAVRAVRTGGYAGGLSGLQVIFARIQVNGSLSETDTYASAAYGEAPTPIDGGGVPICGIGTGGLGEFVGFHLLASTAQVRALRPDLLVNAPPAPALTGAPTVPATPPNPPVATITPPEPAPAFPTTTTAPGEGLIAELVRTCGESLIFVEGMQGQGSGFICMQNGKRFLFSNQHVIQGNPNVRFTLLNQSEVKVGTARAAVGHDIISYEVADAIPALEMVTDFPREVSVGDPVVVLGNTEGARVIKPLPGKVVGIGPNLVEISSEFMPGNSGSPIIHARSGKVIGIATYAVIRDVNSLTGERQKNVRRFGFRLDSVQNWQQVIWPIYQAEAAATRRIGEFSGAIINLLLDAREGGLDPSKHGDSKLRPALGHLANLHRSGLNAADRTRMVQNFLGEIRNTSQRDVEDLRPRLRYDYFIRELAEEAKFRNEIYTGIGEAMKKLR